MTLKSDPARGCAADSRPVVHRLPCRRARPRRRSHPGPAPLARHAHGPLRSGSHFSFGAGRCAPSLCRRGLCSRAPVYLALVSAFRRHARRQPQGVLMAVRTFERVLVANRSEIAIRVFRACTELGIRTLGIFSKEDRSALHRYKADESYPLDESKDPLKAYLDIDGIVAIAKRHGADAIHPGYGFLSENADFARACEAAGIAFIGPPPRVLEMMGDKTAARRQAQALNISVVPGTDEPLPDANTAAARAKAIGYPVILKASFGGGGRGMRVCKNEIELREFLVQAEREAAAAFGRGEIFLEKYIERPKHIEVQILA